MRNESGFTLIEIIVSLVLVGMMAAIAGMGIVTGTKGYLLAKENSHMAQKAQLAMARIQRELMELTDIAATQSDPDYIIYDNTSGRHAIARDGAYVKMYFNLASGAVTLPVNAGDILVDNVNNFTLSYFQGSNPWGGGDIQLLSAIQADLALDRSDGAGNTVTFTTTVNPRNTNNYGGVPPDTTPYTAHNYSCFVATAAYGDFDPPIMLLFSLSIVAVMILNHFFLTQRHKGTKAKGLVLRSRRRSRKKAGGWEAGKLGENKGNVLIGLIVTMMIFAALGAGMVAMTGTSTSSQVTANTTSKAYYLAESGFRYAASEYLDTGDTDTDGEIEDDRNQRLIDLDGATFTFVNHDERFDLQIFSYYFITTVQHLAGSTTINTRFAGAMPTGFAMPLNNGRIRIGDGIYTYSSYDSNNVQFVNLTPGLSEDIGARMNVLPVGVPSGAVNMTNGGDLTLRDASFFPAITGKFMIDGIAYTYKTKDGDTLENITNANDPNDTFSIPVSSTTNLILKPYLKIYSTGTVGQDDQAASREIVYNVPIPDSPTEGVKVEFHDQFADKSHWKDPSILGSHEIQTIGGDSALKVTSTQTSGGAPKASLIGLDWSSTNANLASAHSLSGHFLSYDAQVKVGFVPNPTPDHGFCDYIYTPERIPCYYAAGLSFRLDESNNSYGVSFLRGSVDKPPTPDNIDDAIVPKDQISMIVLWQQINLGVDRQWLAYKYLTGPVVDSHDMESAPPSPPSLPSDWLKSPIGSTWARTNVTAYSETSCLTDSPGGDYVDGVNESVETSINLSGYSSAILTFWHKYEFNADGDFGQVEINGVVQPDPAYPDIYTGQQSSWEKVAIDISSYLPNVTIAFRIQTAGGVGTNADGWYIDDVTILEGFPVNEATLLVRIKEAAEVRFNSGGTTPIEDGDIVTQANGAYGTVIGEPILSSGEWATGGNATGIITLNKVSETNFQSGQAILVGGINLATCQGFTARNNYIKVFYGDIIGNLPANNDPFDHKRNPNFRNEIHWPPDELENGLWPSPDPADHDFFTLVRWDAVNTADLPTVDIVSSAYETGAIILSDESSLFTPDSGLLSYARPELGLHTFGHGSTNVYFDDFGLQVEIAAGSGFLTPIQE